MIDTDKVRAAAARAIAPLKAADDNTPAAKDFLFGAQRTDAGRSPGPRTARMRGACRRPMK